MSAVLVGIPILKDTRRFHIEKGRRWTIFEHILLEALAKKDWTAGELAGESNLPRRVVIEILIRLMRAGWVHLTAGSGAVIFAATPRGRAYATRSELPPVTRPDSRYISYTVELVTGSVFRARDLTPAMEDQWLRRTTGRAAVRMIESSSIHKGLPDVRLLADTLLEADEKLMRVDVSDWKPRLRIGVVTVRGEDIEGFGVNPSQELKQLILAAAAKATKVDAANPPSTYQVLTPLSQRALTSRPIQYRSEDLILGGDAHESALTQAIARARHRIILHSTFIALDKGREVVELLKVPAQRGAYIDILWGKSTEKDEQNETRDAAQALKNMLEGAGLSDRIRIRMGCTRSHAKIILSDTGDPRKFSAIIGSCNWMNTGFSSFDVSVRLRDPGIVADVAFELSELARPRDEQIPDLTAELVRLGQQLERGEKNDRTGRATARLIRGVEHAQCLLDARDSAKARILVLSHRLGANAKPALKPLTAAAREHGVSPEVFYGRVTGKVTPAIATSEILRSRDEGVEIRAILKPRLHAKLVAWDDDDAVITSLNWLSADPGETVHRQEIGVRISAPGVARRITDEFRTARDFS